MSEIRVIDYTEIKEELNDYKGDFIINDIEHHLDVFSREFLIKVAKVHRDILTFAPAMRALVYSEFVGIRKAYDTLAMVMQGIGQHAFPVTPYNPKLTDPFHVQLEDLSKEGVLKLIKSQWDQHLKQQNVFSSAIMAEDKELGWKVVDETYRQIGLYEMPKLAEVLGVGVDVALDMYKINQLSIDATTGYTREVEFVSRDVINQRLTKCDVWGRYMNEGVYNVDKAYHNCLGECSMCCHCYMGLPFSIPVIPDLEINSNPETRLQTGEVYCVMQLRSRGVPFVPVKEMEPGNLPRALQLTTGESTHAEFAYDDETLVGYGVKR